MFCWDNSCMTKTLITQCELVALGYSSENMCYRNSSTPLTWATLYTLPDLPAHLHEKIVQKKEKIKREELVCNKVVRFLKEDMLRYFPDGEW